MDCDLARARPRYTANRVTRTMNTGSQASSQLTDGLWEMEADVDCYFKQGSSGVSTDTTNGNFLKAGDVLEIDADAAGSSDYVAALVAAGTGNLYFRYKGPR